MSERDFFPRFDPTFVGRETELQWLDARVFGEARAQLPIMITGTGGVGKTALMQQFVSTRRLPVETIWLTAQRNLHKTTRNVYEHIGQDHQPASKLAIIDDAERLPKESGTTLQRLMAIPALRALFLVGRHTPDMVGAETLAVEGLTSADAATLLR